MRSKLVGLVVLLASLALPRFGHAQYVPIPTTGQSGAQVGASVDARLSGTSKIAPAYTQTTITTAGTVPAGYSVVYFNPTAPIAMTTQAATGSAFRVTYVNLSAFAVTLTPPSGTIGALAQWVLAAGGGAQFQDRASGDWSFLGGVNGPYTATTYTLHGLIKGNGSSSLTAMAVCPTGSFPFGVTASDPICSTLLMPNAASAGTVLVATSANQVGTLTPGAANSLMVSTGPTTVPGWTTLPQVSAANLLSGSMPATVLASRQGNGTAVQMAAGPGSAGNFLAYDANSNAVDSGTAVPGSTGSVAAICPWPLPSGTGTGTTYYVSNSAGNDTWTGLAGAFVSGTTGPWKSIAKAMAKMPTLVPGDMILFKGQDVWTTPLGLTSIHGTNANRIVIGSYGTGQPVLDETGQAYGINACNGTTCDDGGGNGDGSNYFVIVNNFEIKHAAQRAVTFQTSGGAEATSSAGTVDSIHDITIQNSYIHNSGPGAPASGAGSGTATTYRNQLDFESFSQGADNTHYYCNTVQDVGGWNAVQVHADTGAVELIGNIVGTNGHTCGPHGCVDLKGAGAPFIRARVENNTVSCGITAGLCVAGGGAYPAAFYTENTMTQNEAIDYKGNVAYDSGIGFQAAGGSGAPSAACAHTPCGMIIKYYNNTVYSAPLSGYAIYVGDTADGPVSAPMTMDIRNNIFDGSLEASSLVNGGSGCTADYNDQGGSQGAGSKSGCFATAEANGFINIDPLYVSAAAKNYNLLSNSPLINKGFPGLTANNNNIGAFGAQVAGGPGVTQIIAGNGITVGAGTGNVTVSLAPTLEKSAIASVGPCGMGPAVGSGSTMKAGSVVVGTGTVATCSITFTQSCPTALNCNANSNTSFQVIKGDPTALNVLTLRAATTMGAETIFWNCTCS